MGSLAFFLRRVLHRWQTLLMLFLSVTLATGLLASGPLLVSTVLSFALPYKLRSVSPLNSNLRLTVYDSGENNAYQELDEKITSLVEQHLGEYNPQIVAGGGSNWMFPWYLEALNNDQQVNLRFYRGIEEHSRLIAGEWPPEQALQGDVIYAAITESLAEAYTLQVGERLPLSKKDTEEHPSLWLEVTGVIQARDNQEPYWFGEFSPLAVQSDQRYSSKYSAIIPSSTFFKLQNSLFPAARAELNWNVLLDPATIHVEDVPKVRSQLAVFTADLETITPKIGILTRLDALLSSFASQAQVAQLALYLLIVEVLFLALYYLAMAASLSVQQDEGEFAKLASRGGSFWQIFRLQVIEASVICIFAWVCGPLIAWLMMWLLGKIGPISEVRQANWALTLPTASWLTAAIGAIVGMICLLYPVRVAVKRSIVTYTRRISRPEGPSWWQRAYLDVFAAIAALLLTWRLQAYGSLDAGQSGIDWLLLLAPLTLLVSAAVIVLRILPLALRGLAKLTAQSRGLPAALALWYTSRSPTHVARLILLLTLTIALGILSSGLNATLNAIEGERARYTTGSELRLVFNQFRSPDTAASQAGVIAASSVWRGTGSVDIRSYRVFPTFDLLALEPFSFAQVTRYRFDYADLPMGRLLGNLIVEEEQGKGSLIPLPGKPAGLGIWALDQEDRFSGTHLVDQLGLRAKLRTAQGEMFSIKLELTPPTDRTAEDPAPQQEWRYFEASLPTFPIESYPLEFHSLWLSVRPEAADIIYNLHTALDDISIRDGLNGEISVLEDFESIQRIWQTNDERISASFTRKLPAHSGSGTIMLWMPGRSSVQNTTLYPAGKLIQDPLPVLASPEFLAATQLNVGDEVESFIFSTPVPIIISGIVSYFPTLYETPSHGFLVMPRDSLLTLLNREKRVPVNPNEIWIATESAQAAKDLASIHTDAIQALKLHEELQAIKADPLSLGLRSVILMATSITAILTLAGFATHFYMSIRQRETIYSILRALGLASLGLYGTLIIEQILLICSGLVLGTLLGWLLNQLILPNMPLALGDLPPVPPLIPRADWMSLIRFYLLLAIAFLTILGTATALLWRSSMHKALRIGQE